MAVVLMTLAACGGSGSSDTTTNTTGPAPGPAPPSSVERMIQPTTANPAATQSAAQDIAINPSATVAAKGRLLLFLPGTGAAPTAYQDILQLAASRGYHAIGLSYPDALSAADACSGDPDPECTALFHNEIVTGSQVSSHVSVDVANSIVQRTTDLLVYLNSTYPLEGWGQFLVNGVVNWSLVEVGGHSQGSGHAAYLAKLFKVDRMGMFSGVPDILSDGAPAPWIGRPGMTPASSQYGFGSVNDELVPIKVQLDSWAALGMDQSGAATSVDGAAPPFGGVHELTTSAAPGAQDPSFPKTNIDHSVPIADQVTPLTAQNAPVFAPVWTYMLLP